MRLFNCFGKRPAATIVLAMFLGAGLSACGSNTHYEESSGNSGTPTPTPPGSVADAFFSAILSAISASSETDEPNSIDAIAVTSPETTEPEPLS